MPLPFRRLFAVFSPLTQLDQELTYHFAPAMYDVQRRPTKSNPQTCRKRRRQVRRLLRQVMQAFQTVLIGFYSLRTERTYARIKRFISAPGQVRDRWRPLGTRESPERIAPEMTLRSMREVRRGVLERLSPQPRHRFETARGRSE